MCCTTPAWVLAGEIWGYLERNSGMPTIVGNAPSALTKLRSNSNASAPIEQRTRALGPHTQARTHRHTYLF